MNIETLGAEFLANAERSYADFIAKNGVIATEIIGVRVPIIRGIIKKYANEINITPETELYQFIEACAKSNIREMQLCSAYILPILYRKSHNSFNKCLSSCVNYIVNWEYSDALSMECARFLQYDAIIDYARADNHWIARFGLVCAIIAGRPSIATISAAQRAEILATITSRKTLTVQLKKAVRWANEQFEKYDK